MTILEHALIPELSVLNLENSLRFYVDILGFSLDYRREEEGFAFLNLDAAQIMLDEIGKGRTWRSEKLDYPLGRGINLQIKVQSITPLLDRLQQNSIGLFLAVEERWYRKNNHAVGRQQFIVMDPDGYLLRFSEDLGMRLLHPEF